MAVQLVIVSHSQQLAAGVVELASQMAPGVTFHAVGGTDDGGIGTSFSKVLSAVEEVIAAGDDAALLTDLGSATMTAEAVLDFVSGANHVALAEGPLVEGAVSGAVVAHGGGSLREVIAAVADAVTSLQSAEPSGVSASPAGSSAPAASTTDVASAATNATSAGAATSSSATAASTGASASTPAGSEAEETAAKRLTTDLVLRNDVGLHARPAAALSRLAASFNATITVNDKPATSVLTLMALGLGQGATMHVSAAGPDAPAALEAITALVERDFGDAPTPA
ncbi:dihydroxyacetone kinase phosphoryl donor subunit DhaM [Bowdeniella massiliensis]|uniref:dihydroxyacetone kinase phosphoryl donor subunit DhaM n=1 Tax=Bowdeniella massiliensis TaxID=2932264 RepID=UPI002027895B|nr:dihydroxyacetone kinase phosphoryl donor subunit DhaM [Bowdeniella massiliensis]